MREPTDVSVFPLQSPNLRKSFITSVDETVESMTCHLYFSTICSRSSFIFSFGCCFFLSTYLYILSTFLHSIQGCPSICRHVLFMEGRGKVAKDAVFSLLSCGGPGWLIVLEFHLFNRVTTWSIQ